MEEMLDAIKGLVPYIPYAIMAVSTWITVDMTYTLLALPLDRRLLTVGPFSWYRNRAIDRAFGS
ncbi:hypothetical protein A3K63_04930 [Candidatus Micrarchaeota archaeon RBG_16_49_10]|nr:MAG: hypothetical protein A3K63_04930 [Candidatus Micrarchaeota archaeon RBG_16_49_10]